MTVDVSGLTVLVLDTGPADADAAAPTVIPNGVVRVAAADDDRVVGDFVGDSLRGLGVARVLRADAIDESVAIVAENAVDAVIVNCGPGEEVAVARALKAPASPARYVPLILVTRGTDAVARAYDAGIRDFIATPVTPAALAAGLVAGRPHDAGVAQ